MKKINLISIFLLIFLALNSCDESTVTEPKTEDNNKFDISLLTKNVWQINEITPPNGGYYWIPKYKFNNDYTLRAYINNSWINGTWTIVEVETLPLKYLLKIKFETNTVIDSTNFIITTLRNSELKLSSENIGFENIISHYVAESLETNEIELKGNILFDPSIVNENDKNLDQAKLCIVWVNPQDDNKSMIYGIGNIDKNNKSFNIKVGSTFPLSLFIFPSKKIKGYFNVGYVMLLWGDDLYNGKVLETKDFDGKKIGAVPNRAFIYVGGNYKDWDIRQNLLIGNIVQGFNLCEGFYANLPEEQDGWLVTQDRTDKPLIVVPNYKNNSILMPNWN